MVGLAPTSVMVPPMMAQKPMGIKIRDMGTPILLAMRWAAGRKSAAAPMFCIILEMMPTVPENEGNHLFFTVAGQFDYGTGNLVHHAGLIESCADDDYRNNGADCITAQSHKSFFRRYQADKREHDHHYDSNHIDSYPLKNKQDNSKNQNDHCQDHFRCHWESFLSTY
jgi:hypothetical protein